VRGARKLASKSDWFIKSTNQISRRVFLLPVPARVGNARRVIVEADILCKFAHGTLMPRFTIREKNGPQFSLVEKID
jgi:hypothetical protein